ncbi:MarR family transcriptional regulator [Lactobacillus rodentium]|uniref:MarR family transcriptional regulator n=1 Tax=Lactobacillus rodentium TaxID=947835 RepID=A0A2Z6T8P6_9LACO|nr:MarR family transcriptional regulator [Lactobacillus rodentium]MCR1894521.1 MarR family transcriptional regulator [Lactobacillus rodentium]GBG04768.1 MarR family transcriptional regulator [Lactobacillus rodentium]
MPSKKEKFEQANQLFRIYMKNTQRIFDAYASKLDLTSQQARSIAYINRHPGLIQRELGERFRVRNASITNMLKNLERDGYIERRKDKDSARIKRIYLTQKGEASAEKINLFFTKINDQLLFNIDEHDLDMINEAMKHIIKDMKNIELDFT